MSMVGVESRTPILAVSERDSRTLKYTPYIKNRWTQVVRPVYFSILPKERVGWAQTFTVAA